MGPNPNRSSRLMSVLAQPFILWGIAAQATAFAVQWIFKHQELHSPAKPLLGFLPSFMAILFVLAFVKAVRKLDEMRRHIHMQAAGIAFLLTVILTFLFDGLKNAGIYTATLSDIDTATIFIWVVTLIFLSARYR